MSNIKISEMPEATTIGGDDLIPIVQGGASKKTKAKTLNGYSTTERVVGKWIDGRPIYRKVIELTGLPSTAGTAKDYDIGYNRSQIYPLKCESIINSPTWGGYYGNFVVLGSPSNSYISVSFAVVSSGANIQVRVRSSYDLSSYNGYAIIEYIKTADSAS